MITAITIENLRGIAEGMLEGLAPLTILTGPNGCGKSTVLDALLIAVSDAPGDAIGQAVKRHPVARDGARWLVRGNSSALQDATLTFEVDRTLLEGCWLSRRVTRGTEGADGPGSSFVLELAWADKKLFAGSSAQAIVSERELVRGPRVVSVTFASHNAYTVEEVQTPPSTRRVRVHLIDPGLPEPLAESYSDAVRAGARREIEAFLPNVAAGARSLEILSDDGVPSLYIDYEGRPPIPAALAGDGVQSFLQLAIELAQVPNGLALVEEPEVYQHPRALRQTALALVAAMRRGVQIVMTTHSLELIDAIIANVNEDEQDKLAFFSLLLEGGVLKSSRFGGADAAFARTTIERDLR